MARIQNAGLDISAGFIVGFDNDDETIFEDQFRFIQDNGILLAMVGMLAAVPKTPLFERLKQEGRLRLDDANCNIVPKQMTPLNCSRGTGSFSSGSTHLKRFSNVTSESINIRNFAAGGQRCSPTRKENKAMQAFGYGLILAWKLFWALLKDGSLQQVGSVYLHYFFKQMRRYQRGVFGFAQFMNRCVTHWHFYRFTREGTAGRLRLFNSG